MESPGHPGIGDDLALSQSAAILDRALDPCSTQALIGRERLCVILLVPQAPGQVDGILQSQRRPLSRIGRNRVDRIADQHDPFPGPERLGANVIDGIDDDLALRRPDHLRDERQILPEQIPHALLPFLALDHLDLSSRRNRFLGEIDKPVEFASSADMITKEGALAKDEVLHVRGGGKAGMLCEPPCTHQTGVLGDGSVGIDEMTGTRVHAVTAEQERPLGSGAVLESSRHAVLTGREANQLLTKGDLDPLALGSLTQHQVQAGAQDIDAWGSDFRPGSITHLPKLFALSPLQAVFKKLPP